MSRVTTSAGPEGRDRDRDVAGRARNARPRDGLGRPLPPGAPGVPTTPDDLSLPPAESLAEAQRLLDAGMAFHAHEVLEGTWKAALAAERDLPLFVPGWEDSTLGNVFAAHCLNGRIKSAQTVRGGVEYMMALADWYQKTSKTASIGFFQIGGGIAGDFPICVVPMLHQDLRVANVPLWGYFCQVSDSTTSYGSYSGAVPNEKITWGKLGADTPKFVIESDATIVVPLIFAKVLGW